MRLGLQASLHAHRRLEFEAMGFVWCRGGVR